MQGTDQWRRDKLGKISCSPLADLMAKTKSGPAASRENYMIQIIKERLTGTWEEGFVNASMQWGIDMEPLARAEYEIREGVEVYQVGFLDSPKIKMFGGSPDGLVGEEGGIEIKCPNSATHLKTFLTKKIDSRYMLQMQGLMLVTGRKWWDFVSFDPRFPDELAYCKIRVLRDEKLITEIEREVKVSLAELDALEKQLRGLMTPAKKQSIF